MFEDIINDMLEDLAYYTEDELSYLMDAMIDCREDTMQDSFLRLNDECFYDLIEDIDMYISAIHKEIQNRE